MAYLHFLELLGNISFYLESGAFLFKKKKKKAKSNTYSLLAPWGTICLCSCQMPDTVYQLVINCVCLSGAVYSLFLKLFGSCMLGLKMMRLMRLIKLSCRLDNSTITHGFCAANKHFYAVICETDTLQYGWILVFTKFMFFCKGCYAKIKGFLCHTFKLRCGVWLQLCLLRLISSNWHPWKNTWLSNLTWTWLSVFWWAHTLVFRLDTSISQQVTQTGFSGLAHRLVFSFIVFAHCQHEFP